MQLSKKEFTKLLQSGDLALSLIGMSNIGKTYWSKKFATRGFRHISCDDFIEQKLAIELGKLGYRGIEDVARWMGQPHEKHSALNQRKYLRYEEEAIKQIIHRLAGRKFGSGNVVIDTTGSIAHISEVNCFTIKKLSLVIYIEATEKIKEQMFERYMREPKPVVWENVFQKKSGESNKDALKRCYPELLALRSGRYAKYADVVIPRIAISKNTNVEQFISLIKQEL